MTQTPDDQELPADATPSDAAPANDAPASVERLALRPADAALARARAVITRPLRRLNRRLRPAWARRRRRRRDELQAQFSRYSRAYFQRWLLIGAAIGVAAGLVMALFYYAIHLATAMLGAIAGFIPPDPAGEGATVFTPIARPWLLPVVVGLGGLIVGLIVYNIAPETERGGTDSVLRAFHEGGGMIRKRVAPVKLFVTAITIGSGGSAGREGAAAQIMAGIGSWLAQTLRLDEHDRRIATVAGMGAGIGTIFRAPFAGAIFGAEVLYKRDFEADAIFPTFIASAVGYAVFGTIVGWQPVFGAQTDLGFHDPRSLIGFLILGVLAGALGLLFEAAMKGVTAAFVRLRMPRALKPAIGGVLVGLIGVYLPESLGMGYGFIQFAVNNNFVAMGGLTLALLVFAKIATTSLTLGSGGSGGDVAPAMVVGGFMGGAVWSGLHAVAPALVAGVQPGAFVLVGMAAFFGGISKTPLAMILMVIEMSGELSLIAPAMLATMVAYVLTGDISVYHWQKATRLDSPAHRDDEALAMLRRVTVRETLAAVGGAPPPVVASDAPLSLARDALRHSGAAAGLARQDGRIAGIFTLSDLNRATSAGGQEPAQVGQIISRAVVTAYPDETLYAAWLRMTRRRVRRVLVVERGRAGRRLGLLTQDEVRQALRPLRGAGSPAAAIIAGDAGADAVERGAEARPAPDPLAALRVSDAMRAGPATFNESTPVEELRAAVYRDGCALVVDASGALTGIIVARDLRERLPRFMTAGDAAGRSPLARDIATRNLVTTRPRERLRPAIRRMLRAGVRRLPVVESEIGAPVGVLSRADALAALDRLTPREEPGEASSSANPRP